MKLAELSRRSRISAATIKYYLREGMLQPGTKVRARLSEYEESHLKRLDLIDTLIHVVGLSVNQVKTILSAVDDPDMSLGDVLTRAAVALPSYDSRAKRYSEEDDRGRDKFRENQIDEEHDADRDERLKQIREDLKTVGFEDLPDLPYVRQLEGAIDAARKAGIPWGRDELARFADLAREVAKVDFSLVPWPKRKDSITVSVLGMVMTEPILIGLRRLAHLQLSKDLPRTTEPS
ncbi:MAG: MerR family transcriptional regulator [Bifidobacteriales bacterium]|nr:MerR family transcriptional regulator [Bifidobacteriales bacterium]